MASDPNRRNSREQPLNLSELMKQRNDHADSFIKRFDNKKTRMTAIERRFKEIADELKDTHEATDRARTVGAVVGAVGGAAGLGVLALGLIAAPFTGGASLAAATTVGGVVGATGGATVLVTNVTKSVVEKFGAKDMEKLGKEFLEIVKPLKDELENIMKTCEKLEEKTKEVQAADTLADLEAFKRILRKVAELRGQSAEVFDVTVLLMQVVEGMIKILVNIFRVTATPEEDKKLRNSIIESARLCSKVVQNFNRMKEELRTAQLLM